MAIKDLKKSKMWIGLQFGNSLIAKQIKKYSKVYYPYTNKLATHVIALVYQYGHFYVYEATIASNKTFGLNSGARHYTLKKFFKIEEKSLREYVFYPIKFNKRILDDRLGESYAFGSIKDLILAGTFKNNGKQKDRTGVICSEYLALAYKDIQKYFNLPAYCITPAHWQRYCEEMGLTPVTFF